MRKLIAATALILCATVPALAEPVMKFPNAYKKRFAERYCVGARPYFQCDYTTRTCMRGSVNFQGGFIGEILAEDRSTVIAHVECTGYICTRHRRGYLSIVECTGTNGPADFGRYRGGRRAHSPRALPNIKKAPAEAGA